ncbi:hypothetical protein [Bdellovibrio sp. HCB-110]|uniref:hypothetical protein n=1 Tax=Bdellovibrio sp. HCB-110 TaxID=3391182 RepID=UPI0039B4C100
MRAHFSALMGLILLFGPVAEADFQISKLLDGSVAYCNSQMDISKGEKFVGLELIKSASANQNENPTLKISLLKCENGNWVQDQFPNVEKYVAPNGMKVEVTYSRYQMLLVNNEGKIILETSLDQFNRNQSSESHSLSLANEKGTLQEVDLIIRALKTVKAENGYEYSEPTVFGGFRIGLISND